MDKTCAFITVHLSTYDIYYSIEEDTKYTYTVYHQDHSVINEPRKKENLSKDDVKL